MEFKVSHEYWHLSIPHLNFKKEIDSFIENQKKIYLSWFLRADEAVGNHNKGVLIVYNDGKDRREWVVHPIFKYTWISGCRYKSTKRERKHKNNTSTVTYEFIFNCLSNILYFRGNDGLEALKSV